MPVDNAAQCSEKPKRGAVSDGLGRSLLGLLPRILAINVGYAFNFAVFHRFPDGLGWSVIPGSLFSLLIALIRTQQIERVALLATTSLFGMAIGASFMTTNEARDPVPTILWAVLGAANGGMVGLVYSELHPDARDL